MPPLGAQALTIVMRPFPSSSLTVKRTIVPNRIALYRRFRNEARVQQGVIRIPRRLFGANWLEQLRELLPTITVAA